MTPLTVRRFPRGPRLWVLGQRVHHGAVGSVLLAAALARPNLRRLALAGAALVLHDRADWRVWFARELMPASVTNPTLEGVDTEVGRAYPVRIPTRR